MKNLLLALFLCLCMTACGQSKDSSRTLGSEAVTLQDGSVRAINSLVATNGYTLIDTWASWCRPCRRAIAILKPLSVQYKNQLTIISVSCDQDAQQWRQAVVEEAMPWQQAIVTPQQAQVYMSAYGIQYIPYLMLVKGGKIVLTTNNPEEVASYLSEHL